MIYTSTKALQFLSIPVYTIFKNLTIILIAYGEVLWFGGSVTGMALLSFGLMVLSSVIAAWADIQHALTSYGGDSLSGEAAEKISTLNAGYMWMLLNCFCSASFLLGMRKRIKLTNFKDLDSKFYSVRQAQCSRCVLIACPSHVLQQPSLPSRTPSSLAVPGKLVRSKPRAQLPRRLKNLHDLSHGLHRALLDPHLLRLCELRPSHEQYNVFHGRRPEQTPNRNIWPRLL